MKHQCHTAIFLVCVLVVAASTGWAQTAAVVLFMEGGRNGVMTTLADETSDEITSGFSTGGGLSLMIGPSFAIRAHVTGVRSKLRAPALALQDSSVTRLFYGADLLVGRATELGLAPYAFGGIGAVRINPEDPDRRSFTAFAARVGAGFNYITNGSPIIPFLEGKFWFYDFNRFGFAKRQVDFIASIGLALAIPF